MSMLQPAPTTSPSFIDKFIWNAVHSSPSTMTTYAAMACMLKGLLLGVIMVNAWRYFSLFHQVDGKIVLFGIALGTASSIAQTGLNAYQVRQLIRYTPVNYAGIARSDAWETLSVAFITAHFNAAATAFYSWRAWKLSGQKRWMMAILVLGIVASYALVFPLMIGGAKMPEINAANAGKLQTWLMLQAKLIKAWGCTSVGVDISICTLLVWLFLRKQESMFHAERALLKRLLILVFETMIPPTVVMLILVCWTSNSIMTDFWRVLVWSLPDLYFLSILHSLISRRTIKSLLDTRVLSDGVKFVNGQRMSISTNRTRVAEEGRVYDAGSIKVEVDTLIIESPSLLSARSPQVQDAPGDRREEAASSPLPISPSSVSIASNGEKRQSRRKPAPRLEEI